MIDVDFRKTVLQPYLHQKRGTKTLLARPTYGLFWEMRTGKSKALIDAACFLKEAGELDAVMLVCPAQVKAVWGHKKVGEIASHSFVPSQFLEAQGEKMEYIDMLAEGHDKDSLLWVAVSHELLRAEDKRGDFPNAKALAQALEGRKKVWLVHDEASAYASYKSLQTRAAIRLREVLKPCRVTTLDGTPVGNSPMEQYSKFKVLDPAILGYENFFHFRANHGVMEKKVIGKKRDKKTGELVDKAVPFQIAFKRQEVIDAKVRPFCEYLEQKDCLDMPATVSQSLVARLSPKTWRAYSEMRDDMVSQLETGLMSASHASVKVLRLAQLCAGFAGGVELEDGSARVETHDLSDESTKALMEWIRLRTDENHKFRCVVWCRWRPEIERLVWRLRKDFFDAKVSYGSKKDYDEELHPKHQYDGPLVLVAQPQSLKYGTNLSKADTQVFLSQDYNSVTRAQAEMRIVAPVTDQQPRRSNLSVEVLVEGPNGERTVTWDIMDVLKNKTAVAKRTAGEWKKVLTEA